MIRLLAPARVVDGRVELLCARCADAPARPAAEPTTTPEATTGEPHPVATPAPRRRAPALIAVGVAAGVGIAAAVAIATHVAAGDAVRARPAMAGELTEQGASLTAVVPTERPRPLAEVGAGQSWRLETRHGVVRVWVPDGYDSRTAAVAVYVHGYATSVDDAWRDHRLPEQFANSTRNAIFIAPTAARDNDAAFPWPAIDDLIGDVRAELELPWPRDPLRIAIGHSGAFRTIAHWITRGRIDHVILLDGLYGGERRFGRWIDNPDWSRRLTLVAHATIDNANAFVADRDDAVIRDVDRGALGELSPEARAARILYLRARDGHFEMLTGGAALPALLAATAAEPVAGALAAR